MDKTLTDARGRVLTVHEMDPADELDLFEACGDNSMNRAWLGQAMMICSVVAIDGTPIPFPNTKEKVKALARQLGRDGMKAITDNLTAADTDVKPATASEDAAVAKNS